MKPMLKPSTVAGYAASLKAYLLPRFGDWRLGNIDRAALIALDQNLTRDGLSPATRNNIVLPLRTIIWNAIELGEHHRRPDFPRLNRVLSKVYEPPSAEDVEAVLAAADVHARVAFALAAYAGLRASEVVGLRWVNVNLATGLIFVREAITLEGAAVVALRRPLAKERALEDARRATERVRPGCRTCEAPAREAARPAALLHYAVFRWRRRRADGAEARTALQPLGDAAVRAHRRRDDAPSGAGVRRAIRVAV